MMPTSPGRESVQSGSVNQKVMQRTETYAGHPSLQIINQPRIDYRALKAMFNSKQKSSNLLYSSLHSEAPNHQKSTQSSFTEEVLKQMNRSIQLKKDLITQGKLETLSPNMLADQGYQQQRRVAISQKAFEYQQPKTVAHRLKIKLKYGIGKDQPHMMIDEDDYSKPKNYMIPTQQHALPPASEHRRLLNVESVKSAQIMEEEDLTFDDI